MIDIELLRVLYKQLSLHSKEWKEEITAMNFIVQETHKITGKKRADIVHLVRILVGLKMLNEKSQTPTVYCVDPIPLNQLEDQLIKGSTAPYEAKDLFQLLDLIERRPGMILLEARLDYLYTFLSGYKFAASFPYTEYTNLEKLDEFSEFLFNAFDDKYRNSMTWFGVLNSEFDSGEKGLEMFFKYMWEFRLQNGCD